MEIEVILLTTNAKLPQRANSTDAGADLFASEAKTVPARGWALVKTGISVAVPAGHYGRIAPRSGLAFQSGIGVNAGVIDSDYRGEIGVILTNLAENDFGVWEGDKIAQFIIEVIATPVLFKQATSLPDTSRGEGGFGSTGAR